MSTNQALKLNDDSHESSIILDELSKIVTIHKLQVENSDLYNLMDKKSDGVAKIIEMKKIIDLGVFVKNKVQMAVDTDYFDKRISEITLQFEAGLTLMENQILTTIEQKFDPAKSDSYSNQLQKFFESKKSEMENVIQTTKDELVSSKLSITNKINESFDPNIKQSYINQLMEFIETFQKELIKKFDINQVGSVNNQMKEFINKLFSEEGEFAKTLNSKLSFDNPQSTISLLQKNIVNKLDEIKTELVASKSAIDAEKEILDKSTQKGLKFEDTLFAEIEEFAKLRGDIVEDVSNIQGEITGCKKGDFLYTVKSLNKIIVIEAKNQKMEPPSKLLKTLDETKSNRNADYVVYICSDDAQLHKQVGTFQEYVPDKLVTHFGLLEIALKLAISRLMLDTAVIDGIDRAATEKEIETIKNSLQSFRIIKKAATNILNQSQKIQDQADQIRNEVSTSLDILTELLLTPENQSN